MSEELVSVELEPADRERVGSSADALTKLALVQVEGLTIFQKVHSHGYDYAAATEDGLFVLVSVAAYSSRAAGIDRVEAVPELRWSVPADEVRRARASVSPVYYFLFDASTRHGRYARLDVLPASPRGAKVVPVGFPLTNIINPASITRLVAELRATRRSSAA